MRQLIAHRDSRSIPLWASDFSQIGDSFTTRIAADTDVTISIPAGSRFALLSGDDFFFVGPVAITLPSLGVVSPSQAEIQKTQIHLDQGQTEIHVRSRNEMDFSISFWR